MTVDERNAWLTALHAHIAALHALAMDATSKRRVHSRRHLREAVARETKRLRKHIDAIGPVGLEKQPIVTTTGEER
jgi:hypothetical protein